MFSKVRLYSEEKTQFVRCASEEAALRYQRRMVRMYRKRGYTVRKVKHRYGSYYDICERGKHERIGVIDVFTYEPYDWIEPAAE